MNLCPKCNHSPWPFGVVLLLALVLAFVTWLMLGLSPIPPIARVATSMLVFFAVGATLLHYVLSCLRRHCRHEHDAPRRPARVSPHA